MPVAPADVATELRRTGLAEVDDSTLTRALYSSDASLYRVVPQVVVRPRRVDDIEAVLSVVRTTGVPLTVRGAGTSIAGNAVGTGIVMDTARHLTEIHVVDRETKTAVVDPGVVHARLQERATAVGLRFGPDPSTHTRCTVGGMIGNNACGSRALGYGRTVDNLVGLEALTVGGERLSLSSGQRSSATTRLRADLAGVTRAGLATIRDEFGRFGRQVSGYSLEHLLPENGADLARFLVGSEGTLAVVTRATVRLVEDAPYRRLVVLGYPTMADAADDVPALLPLEPVACEGLGAGIVEVVRGTPGGLPDLPRGQGWLFVEVVGGTEGEVDEGARAVLAAATTTDARIVHDPDEAAALWRIREAGAGLAGRSLARPAHPGWEDAAVPPDRLGAYLRDFEGLLAEHGLDGVPYGHFGEGCLHIRIDFETEQHQGRRTFRTFVTEAAQLVASYGGSLSGEHGDGRARSELLPLMYSAEALRLFGHVKQVFDPGNLLNPGVLVEPHSLDADLRGAGQRPIARRLALALRHDGGDFSAAVHRCTGVGTCLAANAAKGQVMCPSFQATREEKDSTRGRARVLQEMVNGGLVDGGWRSPEVHAALDLCLACKGCLSDCPTGTDMAAYKAEVLHQAYRRRLRPRSHYTLGRLPRWARLAARAPRVANAALTLPGVAHLSRWAAGVDQRRRLPTFAAKTFRAWARGRPERVDDAPRVAVWADTFTDHFAPSTGRAVVEVLESAGYRVEVPDAALCCGLTWISTGQLDTARRILGRTVTMLADYAEDGVPVVGVEPSCTAVLRSDALELVPGRQTDRLASSVRTLAEQLGQTPGWTPPDLAGVEVVAQPHCHHTSVLGWTNDERLLTTAGAAVTRVGGCCGLAGNFGVEKGHHDVSVAVAETALLPAVRAAAPDRVVLADGFSCRTQLTDLAGVDALHLAELLAGNARAPLKR